MRVRSQATCLTIAASPTDLLVAGTLRDPVAQQEIVELGIAAARSGRVAWCVGRGHPCDNTQDMQHRCAVSVQKIRTFGKLEICYEAFGLEGERLIVNNAHKR